MATSPRVNDPIHRMLAANVRRLAESRGWTLVQLADFAGVGRGRLYAILDGHGSPTIRTVKRIADALGVPIDGLLRPPEK